MHDVQRQRISEKLPERKGGKYYLGRCVEFIVTHRVLSCLQRICRIDCLTERWTGGFPHTLHVAIRLRYTHPPASMASSKASAYLSPEALLRFVCTSSP